MQIIGGKRGNVTIVTVHSLPVVTGNLCNKLVFVRVARQALEVGFLVNAFLSA